MYFRVSVDYLEWKNDRKYLILQKISTHIETVSSLKGYNIHFCQSAVNIPNIFCQFKYFLGTRFPGSTTISRSASYDQVCKYSSMHIYASMQADLEIVVESGNLVPRKYLNWQKICGIFTALWHKFIIYPFSELTVSMCVAIFCRIKILSVIFSLQIVFRHSKIHLLSMGRLF